MRTTYYDPIELSPPHGESCEHVIFSVAPVAQFESIEQFHKCSNWEIDRFHNLWCTNEFDEYKHRVFFEIDLIDGIHKLFLKLTQLKLSRDKEMLHFRLNDDMYDDLLFIHEENYYRFIWQSGA